MPRNCCAVNCKTNAHSHPELQFYILPKDPLRKKKWLNAIKRYEVDDAGKILDKLWSPKTRYFYVCSRHFITGEKVNDSTHPDYVPSKFSFHKDNSSSRKVDRVTRILKKDASPCILPRKQLNIQSPLVSRADFRKTLVEAAGPSNGKLHIGSENGPAIENNNSRNEKGMSSSCSTNQSFSGQIAKQCPAAVITDVGQPVTVIDTDQEKQSLSEVNQPRRSVKQTDMLTRQVKPSKRSSQAMKDYQKWRRESAGSSVGDQELSLVTDRDFMAPNSKVAKSVGQPVTVIDIDQEKQFFSEVNQPRRSVKQTDMLTSQVRPSKRSSQVMKEHQKWRRESAGSSVGDQELGLVTDRDFMAPNSKVANFEANVKTHAVLQEAMVFPQSTIATTQKEKRTLSVPNHQVAVMSNLLSMWKAGQLCDFYISNGTTKIMVHKMVLGAVCPKMLAVLNSSYSKVTLPSYISKEAMLAFAEYMYTGVLDLNQDILLQLKTIAQRLAMKDFEELCSRELQKAKLIKWMQPMGESLMAEPCSLSGLLSSSTQRTTDSGHFQNTTFRPLLKPLENINSSNSQRVVPTDNIVVVGGPLSSLSVSTLRSAPATTTAGQVIDIKIELESDEETLSIPIPKMKPCNPVRDQYGIQENLIDFENITSNTRVGLQLARPSMINVPSNIATITDQFPTTSNSIPYPVGLFTSDGIEITPNSKQILVC